MQTGFDLLQNWSGTQCEHHEGTLKHCMDINKFIIACDSVRVIFAMQPQACLTRCFPGKGSGTTPLHNLWRCLLALQVMAHV